MRDYVPARLLACLTIAVTTAVIVGFGAFATPAAATGRPATLDPAAQFLMHTYKLTPREANARIILQDRAVDLLDGLHAAFGESYGGLWIDQPGGGHVVVGVQLGQKPIVRVLAKRHRIDRLRVVTVERTVAQLRAIQAQAGKTIAANAASGVEVGGLYLPTNQVTIRVDATVSAAQAVGVTAALAIIHPGRLRFVPAEGVVRTAACVVNGEFNVWCDAPLRGGVGINSVSVWCSAAFNVRSVSDGKRYLLSAGHRNSGGIWQTRFADNTLHNIGPTHSSYYNSAGDGGYFPNGDNNYCSTTWLYQGIRGALDRLNVRLVTTSSP